MVSERLAPGERPSALRQPREAVPDAQAIIELQRAYYQGEIPREAAVTSARVLLGFSPEEVGKLFPMAEPVARRKVPGLYLVLGCFVGTAVGAILGFVW